jgi:zinc transporter ZupT
MTALLFAALTFVSTEVGGLFALHRRCDLCVVLGAAAGLLVGSALLDLLPDALRLVADQGRRGVLAVAFATAAGFLAFGIAKEAMHHSAADRDGHGTRAFGSAAALGLTVHSFLDGMAIGAAFAQSATLGALVGIAVIAHDFGDGLSTVGVVLGSRGARRTSLAWLLADASAPFAGALSARALHMSRDVLAELLGFFAGTFLFVGAAYLLPEAAHEGRRGLVATSVAAGVTFIGAATWILGGSAFMFTFSP